MNCMRVLLFGKTGQIGSAVLNQLSSKHDIIASDRSQVDFNHPDTIEEMIRHTSPDIVVNAAAYTAVDAAESNPELAMQINGYSVEAMAELSGKMGFRMIHFSTDYVFDGTLSRPYREDDLKNPINTYGASKAYGDDAVLAYAAHATIFRISWVISTNKVNFIDKIMAHFQQTETAQVVCDQVGSVTPASLAAEAVELALDKGIRGSNVYHLCSKGEVSWHDIAMAVYDHANAMGLPIAVQRDHSKPIQTGHLNLPANRPLNSRLNCTLIQNELGIFLPGWQDSVLEIFNRKFAHYGSA